MDILKSQNSSQDSSRPHRRHLGHFAVGRQFQGGVAAL